MMSKPESYPFLRIARQFNVDYSDVLNMAHFIRHGGNCQAIPYHWREETHTDVLNAISAATGEQRAVSTGVIDWQTGDLL